MAVYYDIGRLPPFHKAVITIGTFDGVHQGHRAILKEVVDHANAVGGESVLLTFEPHPRKVLFPDQPIGIITPLDQKLQLIAATGIKHVVVVSFTMEFAALTATGYIEDFLTRYFNPHSIIIGYDHRFGHDRTGNIDLLQQYAGKYSYEVVEIPVQLIEHAAVSSTKIRKAIETGQLQDAGQMLGRWYAMSGRVVHGNKLGRTLGYPTANLEPTDTEQLMPGNGIYAVKVVCDGVSADGMMSIGFNPTVSDKHELKVEVNIFDFDRDIYGSVIEVSFGAKLRDERKFDNLHDLIIQLHDDKLKTIAWLEADSAATA